MVQYLGKICGSGEVKSRDEVLARAQYEIEGFWAKPKGVTGSGEIRMPKQALRQLFGRMDLQMTTEDGRLLNIRFSEKDISEAGDSAWVDVTGDLPAQSEWLH